MRGSTANCMLGMLFFHILSLATFPCKKPDKGKFEHFVRMLLKQKLAEQLEQEHTKWTGVAKADLDTTTALVRKLQPDSPLRVPMIRMLADAHATPHKLNKMGIFSYSPL